MGARRSSGNDRERSGRGERDGRHADAVAEPLPVVDRVQQEWLKVRVRVVDAGGERKGTPWALRSSQGHGLWLADDKRSGVGPQDAVTDDSGVAVVRYPAIRSLKEQVKTNGMSIVVDHPDFARSGDVDVDVPLETMGSHEVKLARGVRLEVRPIVDGKPAPLDNLHAVWSDGRARRRTDDADATKEGTPVAGVKVVSGPKWRPTGAVVRDARNERGKSGRRGRGYRRIAQNGTSSLPACE